MSYICEYCSLRPENCACSVDLTEPRLESELALADNMMAVENSVIRRTYGLIDAPSASAFFSLLIEMESETKYDTPPQTPISTNNLLPIPKLERQTNRPPDIFLSEEDFKDIAADLFPEEPLIPDADFSQFEIKYCQHNCGNMVQHGMCYDCIMEQQSHEDKHKDQLATDCGTYDYYNYLIECPTCEEMILPNKEYGMCYTCFMNEQSLYPDDIAMELRYSDSF